jgi:hypothetical protein
VRDKKKSYTENTEGHRDHRGRVWRGWLTRAGKPRPYGAVLELIEVGDFFVEVSEGGFERPFVIGVCCGFEVVGDSDAG